MRKHDDTPWLSETLPYEERVHSGILGAAAVRADNERVESWLTQDASQTSADAPDSTGQDRLDHEESAAIDEFRRAVDELGPRQRNRFERFMDMSAPPVLDYMRDAIMYQDPRKQIEDEYVPRWSEWLGTKSPWSAEDLQVLNVLQWSCYVIGETQSSPLFRAVERDAKQRTNERLREWHRLGYVTILPNPERIARANVVLGNMLPTDPQEQLGAWSLQDPGTIVLAPGSGRTVEERLHSMQKDNELRHVVLHELGHLSFWGLGKYWFIREALNEFRTMLMEREPDTARRELDNHESLLSDESDIHSTVRELVYVLLTGGRKVISMRTALRADTALPDSNEVEVLESAFTESWGGPNVLSAVADAIHMCTERELDKLMNDPGREDVKEFIADEWPSAESRGIKVLIDALHASRYRPASA